MQVFESIHSTSQELSISCKVLGSLIIQSKNIPEIQKQVSTQIVKQFINIINNLNSEKKCGPIYYLIAVLLHQYPEVCERFQVINFLYFLYNILYCIYFVNMFVHMYFDILYLDIYKKDYIITN